MRLPHRETTGTPHHSIHRLLTSKCPSEMPICFKVINPDSGEWEGAGGGHKQQQQQKVILMITITFILFISTRFLLSRSSYLNNQNHKFIETEGPTAGTCRARQHAFRMRAPASHTLWVCDASSQRSYLEPVHFSKPQFAYL